MRITCTDMESFAANVSAGSVHLGKIWYERTLRSLTEDPVRHATSVVVTMRLSAVLVLGPEDMRLLEMAEECGVDRRSQPQSLEGSERADKLLSDAKALCEVLDLQLLPGQLNF